MNRSTVTDERLTAALIDLASDGRRPPCGDAMVTHLWTSDNPGDRAMAARMCHACPILAICHEAAEARNEMYVWGGIDRGVTPTKKKTPTNHLEEA